MCDMQHYLIEVMARCTDKLSIVVLQRSNALSKIIQHWECESKEKQLIDHWKVKESLEGKKIDDYDVDENLKLITINCSTKKHGEMGKMFDQHEKQDIDFNRKRRRAEKVEEDSRKRKIFERGINFDNALM